MTTPISPTSASPSSGMVAAAAASIPTRGGSDTLGKDAFLQLLVAQLRYQDPSKPVDSSEFMAQTAQFTSVEKLEQLVTASQAQQRLSAASLAGQEVAWVDAEGITRAGVVDSVRLSGTDEPQVHVNGAYLPLSSITEFRQATVAPAAGA